MAKKPATARVLVVDDEPLIRWSLTQALEDDGWVVTQAVDGGSALDACAAAALPFDVILLDLRMPDTTDLSVLSRMRQLEPSSRVILMTAYDAPDVIQSALDLGAFGVVHKPFEMGAVTDLVHQACETRRL